MKKLYYIIILVLITSVTNIFGQVPGAPVVSINSGNPRFPFPQFLAYSNGAGHSLGNLATTNAPGVVHAEMEKNIREGWQIFANQFVYEGTIVNGVKYITGNIGCPYDCSEGDGYALLAAAYMGDKTIFDGLWMRTHDVRLVKYPRYSDCVTPRPAYKYGTNTLAEPGGDAATDGDVDIALALLMAWYQWGDLMGINDNCGNPISYKTEALHVIKGLVELQNSGWGDCRSTTGEVGLDGYLKNGNTWNETTGWASAQTPCPEFKGPTPLHVDYMAPAYFRAFREFLTAQGVTGWDVDQLYRAEASSDWIVGEWINKDPRNIPIGGWVDVTSGMPVWSVFQQGEDFRAPWRTILNYVWNGNPSFKWNPTTHQVMTGTANTYERDAAIRHTQYLNSPQNAPWNSACVAFGGGPALTYKGPSTLQWNISPQGVGSSAFTLNWVPGTGTPSAVGAQDYNLMGQLYRQCTIEWDVQTPGDGYLTSKPVYFHGWFRLLGLLVVSGNAHSPTQMLPKPNLKIYRDIQLGKTFAYTGDNITYNLSYRNYGSVDATGTVIVEHVPVDFAFVSATNGGVYNAGAHTVTWTIGTVPGFKTGALAATQGSVSYTTRIKDNATGRYCTTADITCTNGLGWTSNEFPNEVSATMRRNCVDVIARALKIVKTADRTKANEGNMVTYSINFENSVEAGWIDGGRPGVNVSFAHPVLATPTAVDQSGIKIRLFHDAVEPYIDYGNYRVSYFLNDPGLTCYVGNAGCPTGWDIASSIYEGGNAAGVTVSHELITPGSDARGSWNQRLVVQFAPLLVTTTPHLSNYYGMGARIHLGGTAPLRAVWRVFPSNYNATNWADDWSWDAGAGDGDAGLYFPLTPDWTDPANPNIPVTKWHQHSCQTATKTVDNVLVEEYDGYVWRRILGNGPIPGRDITNVIIKDTLPTGATFGAFVGPNPFGIAPTITTIAGGKQVISWTIPKLQAKQKGVITFTATVDFPSGANCSTADENLINKAWIQGDNESAVGDTSKVIITCATLPAVIKPTTLVKTADKATYSNGDPITYTLKYTQTHGSISKPSLNNLTDWTINGGAWTAGAAKITTVANNTGYMTYDYAYGKNGYIEATVTPQVYATFRVMFRQGSATPIALGIKPLTTSSLELTYIQGGTVLQTVTLTYGGGNPFVLKAHLYDDNLRLWINGDTATSPIWNRTGVPIGIGYGGFGNGNATGGDSYGTHSISNLTMHFDYGYNLVITDPIPAGVSFTSATNSGTNAAGTVTWTIPSAKGAPIPFGNVTTVTWTGVVNTCNTILENLAYVNMMGHASNSIAGQVVVNCGASCPSAPTVTTPVTYCQGAAATALTATGTALKWYTVATGGTGSSTAPTPSTTTVGSTTYYVTQTANGCESPRAPIVVTIIAKPATPTVTTNSPVCAGSALNLTTTAVTGATYAWTGPNSFTSAVQNPSIAAASVAATGTYSLTVTVASCTSTAGSASVTVNAIPATPTVSNNGPICAGSALNLTTTAVTGATYAWTGPNSFTSAVQNPSIAAATVAATGTYSLTVTVGGCTSTAGTTSATVNAIPTTPTPTNNGPLCAGSTLNLTAPTLSGASYAWTGPNSFTSSVQNPSIAAVTTAAAGTYSVIVTRTGCSSTAGTTTVVVNATPTTPTVSNNGPICVGSTLNLTTPTVTGATYSWTGPNSFTSVVQNPSIAATTAAAGTYSVTVSVSGCVSAAGTTTVVVNTIPTTPLASNNGPICSGATLNLTTAAVTGATYSWTGPNSFTSAVQNPSIAAATSAATGTYILTVTVNGCTSTAGTTVATVNSATAAPSASNNGPICAGNTLNLTTPNVTGASFAWTGPNSFTSAVQNPSIAAATAAAAGTYSVIVTVSGCSSAAGTTTAVVNPVPATPTISNNGPICEGNTLNLTTAALTGATYSWTGPNSFTSSVQNPSIASATVAATGTYNLTVTVNGCTSIAGATNATVNTIPTTPTASNNGPICAGTALNLTTPTVTGATYSWTGPNSFTSSSQNPSIAAATTTATGTYNITVSVAGCVSSAGSTTATVNTAPTTPSASNNGPICAGSTLNLTTAAVTGGTYNWTGPNSFTSSSQNPSIAAATIAATGTYNVTVSVAGCVSSAGSTSATVNPIPTTPTASNNGPICAGTALNLTTAAVTGATYSWTGPNSFSSAVQNPSIAAATVAATGTYNLTVSIAGCVSSAGTTTATVNPVPTVTISPVSPLCVDAASVTLSATATPIGGTGTFSGTGVTGNSFNPTTAGAGSHTITYSYTLNGCTSSATTIIIVQNKPTVSFTLPASACAGDATIALTGNQTGGTFSVTPSVDISSGFNPALATPNTLYTITYSYSDGVCSNSIDHSITIYNPAKPIGSNVSEVYTLVPPVPSLTASGIGQKWYSDAALITEVGTGASYTPSSTVVTNGTEGIPGVYTYYVVSTEGGCTSASTAISLTITACSATVPAPVNALVEMCFGDSNPTHKTLEVTTAGTDIRWYFGGVQQQSGTSKTFIPTQTAVGTYTFEVSQYDNTELCESPRATITLQINALPSVSFTPPSAVCEGSTLINFATYKSQPTGIVTCVEAASTCTDFNPTTAGTYNFSYAYTNPANSCTNTTTTQILVRALPNPIISPIANVCEYDAAFSLNTYVNLPGGTFSGTSVSGTNFDPALVTPGTTSTITYAYTDAFSCSKSTTGTIQVIARPTITFNPIAQSCIGDAAFSIASLATPAGGTFSGTGITGSSFDPASSGTFPIVYSLTQSGCSNTASQNAVVNVLPSVAISVPTIICHNGTTITPTASPAGGTITIDGSAATTINPATTSVGMHTINYAYTNPTTGCSNTASQNFEVREINSPTVANKSVILNSTDLTITATGGTGTITWKDGSNAIVGTGNSISHSSSATQGSWNYCVTETDGTCVSDPACMTFTVTNCTVPAPTITPATATICENDAIPTFSTTATGTNRWYDNTNALVYTGNDFNPSFPVGTTGTFNWTVITTDVCAGPPANVSLTINTLPVVSITSNTVECKNTGLITPALSPIGGIFTINSIVSTSINTNTLTAGNYLLDYTYQNPTTLCSNSASKLIEIREITSPTVPNVTKLVSDTDFTLNVTTNNGGTLLWKNAGNIAVGIGMSYIHLITPSIGTWNYCVTESDGTCISSPSCMTLTIIDCPTPAPNVSPASITICDGSSIPTFTVTGTGTMNWYDNTNAIIYTGTSFTPSIPAGTTGIFTWNVTATNTCEGPATTVTLTINPTPVVTITTNNTECILTGVKTPTLSPLGGVLTIDGTVSSVINTNSLSAGNHTLVYTYQNPTTLCTNSSTKTLEIREITAPTISNITKLVTDPDMTLSVGANNGGTIKWYNNSNVQVGTGISMTHSIPPSVGTWNYCVTESDGLCTSNTACMTLTIIDCPVPAPTVPQTLTQSCVNTSIPELQANGAHTIHWYNKSGSTIIHTGATYTPIILGSVGLYEFEVSQNDGTCEGLRTPIALQIIDNPLPIITGNTPACENGIKQTLSAQVSSGTVDWYIANPSTSTSIFTGNSFVVPDLTAGFHDIWIIHTNTCASLPVKTTVEIKAVPAAPTITGNNVCPGNNITFMVTGTGATWYNIGNPTPISSGNSYSITNPPTGTYTMEATNVINGCTSLIGSHTIEVYAKPNPPTGNNESICSDETVPDLHVTSTEAFAVFHWYTDAGLINEISNQPYFAPPADNESHSYYVTQEVNGCFSNYTPISLTVAPVTPKPNVTYVSQYCEGETIQALTASGRNVQWYLTADNASLISTGNSYTPAYEGVKNYTMYVTQTVNNCESAFEQVTYSVLPKPLVPTISSETTPIISCSNDPLFVNATSNAPVTWEINYNTSNPIVYTGTSYPKPGLTPSIGTTNIRIYADNGNCRSNKTTFQYIIHQQPQPPTLTKNVICIGVDNFEIEAQGSNIQWINKENGTILSTSNTIDLSQVYVPGKINYSFDLKQTVNGCESTAATEIIMIYPIPTPDIIGIDSVCENSNNITYLIDNGSDLSTFSWKLKGKGILYKPVHTEEEIVTVDWIEPGIDTLILTETNKYGCVGTTKLPIYIAQTPIASYDWSNIGDDGYLELTNTTIQLPSTSTNGSFTPVLTSNWTVDDRIDTSFINNNEIVSTTLDYGYFNIKLDVTNDFGCKSSFEDEVFIKTSYGIYIPTAFAPQNPALGVRAFQPIGYNLKEYEIFIFDNWGNLLWYSDKLDSEGMPIEEWDGMYQGELLQMGTYIWKMNITFKDGTTWEGNSNTANKSKFGSVVLIR